MKREIKCRAWNTVENKMSQPYTLASILDDRPKYDSSEIWMQWGRSIGEYWEIDAESFTDGTLIELQYTGLTDKNGVEIYEGDIITTDGKHFCRVNFHQGCFSVIRDDGKQGAELRTLFWESNLNGRSTWNPWEVIGNVYQNPELLVVAS